MSESSGFLYIIDSDQFRKKHYKVGYTSNPVKRIKDSCYTTAFYYPCRYQELWKFETKYLNPEKVEKDLHKFLQKHPDVRHLYKEGENACTEMYKCKLQTLKNIINEYFSNNLIKYESYMNVYHSFKTEGCSKEKRKEYIKYLLDINPILGTWKCKQKEIECSCCKRKLQNYWELNFNKDNIYRIGDTCYESLNKDNIKKIVKNKIQDNQNIDDNIKNIIFSNAYLTEKLARHYKIILVENNNVKEIKVEGCVLSDKDVDVKEIDDTLNIFELIECILLDMKEECFDCICSTNFLYQWKRLVFLYRDIKDKNIYQLSYQKFESSFNDILRKPKLCESFQKFLFQIGYEIDGDRRYIINRFIKDKYHFVENYFTSVKEINKEAENHLRYNIGVILGAAGTGKTTRLWPPNKKNAVCKDQMYDLKKYMDQKQNIIVLCPTGKACNMMRNKIKDLLDCRDIDENYNNQDNQYDPNNVIYPYLDNISTIKTNLENINKNIYTISKFLLNHADCQYDVVVIDEISMINLNTIYQLLKIIGTKKVIMLGDCKQLPPVKYPSIMHLFMENKCIITVLTVIQRTNDLKPLYEEARKDNFNLEQLFSFVSNNKTLPVTIHTYGDNNDLRRQLSNVLQSNTCKYNMITHTNTDIEMIYKLFGIDKNNVTSHTRFCVLDVVYMVVKNKYAKGDLIHFNGETLTYSKIQNRKIEIQRKNYRQDKYAIIPDTESESEDEDDEKSKNLNKAIEVERAEVITIHKSQGDTYDNTIIIISEANIQHNLLYTAITRASKSITFFIYKPNLTPIPDLPTIPILPELDLSLRERGCNTWKEATDLKDKYNIAKKIMNPIGKLHWAYKGRESLINTFITQYENYIKRIKT